MGSLGRGRGVLSGTALAAMAVLVFATGCHGGSPAAPAPSPTTASTGLSAPWKSVLGRIRADGTVTTDTALQAFALAFGPLPGVTVPPGKPGTIVDGSFAVRWLSQHWTDLNAQQQAAAARLVPDLAPLVQAPAEHGVVVRPAAMVKVLSSPRRSDFFYTQDAQHEAQIIGAKVGKPLTIPITAHVGLTQDATALGEALVLDGSNGQSGAPAKCSITISAAGDALDGDDLGQLIVHEVWHCFEGQFAGMAKFLNDPSWVIEGEAEWVGDSLYPKASTVYDFWDQYLMSPDMSLFQRSYDAVGFYSQLAQSGVDVWSRLIQILQAGPSASAFQQAGGGQDAFLDLWASGYARLPIRGAAWDIVGPGVPGHRYPAPVQITVADDGTAAVEAKPYANQIYQLTSTSDILVVAVSGHARVSDASPKDYLAQGETTFCHRDGGCECPNQTDVTPPPLALSGDYPYIAVTGGPAGASGGVAGMSLDEYCNKGLTGTWKGTWQDETPDNVSGTFSVTWTQHGNTVSGTIQVSGTPCIGAGTVNGVLKGQTITFGAVQGARTITYVGTFTKKTMSGTYSAPTCGDAAGTWSATRA